MGIKRFFKNKIKDRNFIRNKRKLKINNFELKFFENYSFNFEISKSPEVSIVIFFSDSIRQTLNCLYTVDQYDKNISKEIIIVDNENSENTVKFLEGIPGLTIINSDKNLGFVENINKGIKSAKAEYIYLLNSNVEVQENYLSHLLEIFKTKENAGAVGSKIVSRDNTLQEAGCLILKKSEIVNIGKGEAIDTPQYDYLRKADCSSGNSLLFSRLNAEGNINLLDEAFLSVDSGVADLCLRLKNEQKLDTYYQPLSEIVHVENISNIEKEFFAKDKITFLEKWDNNFTNEIKKPNFLFLEENMPKPDQDSGSRRFLEIVKILQKNGHRIILAVKHFDELTDRSYVKFFRSIGVQVCMDYVTPKDKIVKVVNQIEGAIHSVDIIWIFRPIGFDYWYSQIKNKISGKKIVYDMVDLHYLRMERENNYIDVITKEREKEIEFFKEKEYFGMNTSDAVLSISDEEKNTVSKNGVKYDKIFTVSNIHKPVNATNAVEFLQREGILFIGGYNHLPNIDAVKFLHENIMPLVWQKNHNIKVFVLGPDFPEDLKQRYHSDKFQILGYQKSVDYWFENSRIFVAPLRYGAGVKGKIGQALEFKLPVVTTEIGAEGMSLEDRKTALISDENPQNFADKILELYNDENLWQTLHENSLQPLSKFSIETQEENIKKMIEYLGFKD
ncbi:MAG: glycosyltransferase [Candidatus Chryseobacterium colombiense]|nr:glycosyltransferase [Chryseobacterium sp.]WEK68450.1 MAG: glycosyltransferase [Chryseobacterium sp.]